jgi:transposase
MGKSTTDWSSVTIVGLDLAKHVFQVHGVDAAARVVFNKAIKRDKLLAALRRCPNALSGWKPAVRRSLCPIAGESTVA